MKYSTRTIYLSTILKYLYFVTPHCCILLPWRPGRLQPVHVRVGPLAAQTATFQRERRRAHATAQTLRSVKFISHMLPSARMGPINLQHAAAPPHEAASLYMPSLCLPFAHKRKQSLPLFLRQTPQTPPFAFKYHSPLQPLANRKSLARDSDPCCERRQARTLLNVSRSDEVLRQWNFLSSILKLRPAGGRRGSS